MDEDKGFVVNDKRFSSEEPEGVDLASEDSQAAEAQPDEAQEKAEQDASRQAHALPQLNFPTFIVSLSSSVLVHLGEIEDPGSGAKEVNLPVAKQTIDILAMLEEKTKGNLTEEEASLLKNILYDLRMRYVALAKK